MDRIFSFLLSFLHVLAEETAVEKAAMTAAAAEFMSTTTICRCCMLEKSFPRSVFPFFPTFSRPISFPGQNP